MAARLYYLLSLLPSLPPLGEIPPIDAAEILRIIEQERVNEARLLAEAFHFESQLMQAATLKLLGYATSDTPGFYSFSSDSSPVLIELFLKNPRETGEDVWVTELWTEHLDFMESVGKSIGSSLLCRWAGFEKSLRRQLKTARIPDELGSEADLPASELWDHRDLIVEWRSAPDPLIGEKVLDQARMEFIDTESRRYSFSIDELAAYFLKLSLLTRHAKMSREAGIKVLEEVTTL